MKRMRSRHHRSGSGGGVSRGNNGQIPLNRNHVFESNGPDLRVRGTAQQLSEKYLQLGRDATGTGDRVQAEGYFQHAEHYFRILNAMNQAAQTAQQERAERQRAYEQVRQVRHEYREEEGEAEVEAQHSQHVEQPQPIQPSVSEQRREPRVPRGRRPRLNTAQEVE